MRTGGAGSQVDARAVASGLASDSTGALPIFGDGGSRDKCTGEQRLGMVSERCARSLRIRALVAPL